MYYDVTVSTVAQLTVAQLWQIKRITTVYNSVQIILVTKH